MLRCSVAHRHNKRAIGAVCALTRRESMSYDEQEEEAEFEARVGKAQGGDATQSKMREDWSPDYFPTSARPVFLRVGLLATVILAICLAVYLTSEHPEDPGKVAKRKEMQGILIDDEE